MVMRVVVSIVMIGALGAAGSASAASGAARPVAYQAQTDLVTVLKVEGMT